MIKVAFVGCGGIMQEHYKHLCELPRVKLVGHCDIIGDRAEAAAGRFGGEAFTECEAMYDKVKPHAVFIAVPPYAHGRIEEAAAERGIHLFIEKPIAIDRKTAKRIAAAIRKAKVLSSVGYCFRYFDTSALACQILKGKAISLVTGWWNGGMPGVWWWRQMDKSGGQIMEQTTHLFDLMRYLCGNVAEVYAVASKGCQNHVEDYTVHDSSVVAMRLKNGASATITSSCVCNHGGETALRVVTPEATYAFSHGRFEIMEAGKTTVHHPTVDMFEEEDRIFIEAVRMGKRNRIKSVYPDALKTFYVTCAANESIESGLPVKP